MKVPSVSPAARLGNPGPPDMWVSDAGGRVGRWAGDRARARGDLAAPHADSTSGALLKLKLIGDIVGRFFVARYQRGLSMGDARGRAAPGPSAAASATANRLCRLTPETSNRGVKNIWTLLLVNVPFAPVLCRPSWTEPFNGHHVSHAIA